MRPNPGGPVLRSVAFIASVVVVSQAMATGRAAAGPRNSRHAEIAAAESADAPTPEAPAVPTPEAGVVPQAPDSPPAGKAPFPPYAGPLSFVEHLGAEAFPDHTRGLYGGSLWLEPSFHGLQWPYMPHSGVGLSGSAWVDNGYETIKRGRVAVPDTTQWVQQARATLRATPNYSDGAFFIQGQLELVGNKDQVQTQSSRGSGVVDVDDLWLRFGSWRSWDIKVGRFEAWELYHTGMGLDINTIERRGATQRGISGAGDFEHPDYYGVTFLHDRPNDQGVGNLAVHLYPTSFLRFEILGQLGVSNYVDIGDNSLGGRPAAILDLGWLKLKVGAEYVRRTPSLQIIVGNTDVNGNTVQVKQDSLAVTTQRGGGGTLQFVFLPYAEVGVSAGYGQTARKDEKGSPIDLAATTTISIGGFANIEIGRLVAPRLGSLLLGIGVDYTTLTDNHRDPPNSDGTPGKVDFIDNLQGFAALQYMVAKQLMVKAVVAYANSYFDLSFGGGVFTNTMWSGRLRLMYLF